MANPPMDAKVLERIDARGAVYVGIPGDIKCDDTVNILDAILLSNVYNSQTGSPNWNPNADINGDNVVNILDAIILSGHFGQHVL